MVEVIRYSPEQYDTLLALHLSQEYDAMDSISPPALGFIAYDMATPIAAGFLRMVEGGFAQIDTLVSNGSLSSQMRHEGISAVVDKLIDAGKDLKLQGIVSFSQDKGTLTRAEERGFQLVPHSVIVLPLEKRIK